MTPRYIGIATVLLVAFLARAADLGNQPLWYDEAWSTWVAQWSFAESTIRVAADIHPPIHNWLLHLWVRLFDSSEFSARAPSAFAGLLTVAFVYALAFRLTGHRLAALLAAWLLAVNPYHIHYSQEARMYAVAVMFAALACLAYWRGRSFWLAVGGVGAALSHYLCAVTVLVIILHRLLHWRGMRDSWRRWLLALAAIGGVCALWAAFAWDLIRRDGTPSQTDPAEVYRSLASLFATGDAQAAAIPVLLVSALFGVGLVLSWLDDRRAASFVILGCIAAPGILVLMNAPINPFYAPPLEKRHFVIFTPWIFAGFGVGFAAMLRRPRLALAGGLACLAVLIFHSSLAARQRAERYFRDDFRGMAAAVAALTTADDKIFFISGGRAPVLYYHLGRVDYDVPMTDHAEPVNVRGVPDRAEDAAAMMDWVFHGFTRFWLVSIEEHLDDPGDLPGEPRGSRLRWINERYHRAYHVPIGWYNGISLYSLDKDAAIPEVTTVIPPLASEARPGDYVRIGAPADSQVELLYDGRVLESRRADAWQLHQFAIGPEFAPGEYALRLGEQVYPFQVSGG